MESYKFREASLDDALPIYQFFKAFDEQNLSGAFYLGAYNEDFYRRFIIYQPGTVFVLVNKEKEIVSVAHGFACLNKPGSFFLWQIAVHSNHQKKGLGKKIMQGVETALRKKGFQRIELTIYPTNKPSQKLFEKIGYRDISAEWGKTVEINGRPAATAFNHRGGYLVYEKKL